MCWAALRDVAPRFARHGSGKPSWGQSLRFGVFFSLLTPKPAGTRGFCPGRGFLENGGSPRRENRFRGTESDGAAGPFPQDVLTLSSSTDSEGENGAAVTGQGPGAANDSDDIQTISSGSGDEDEKRNAAAGAGERGTSAESGTARVRRDR